LIELRYLDCLIYLFIRFFVFVIIKESLNLRLSRFIYRIGVPKMHCTFHEIFNEIYPFRNGDCWRIETEPRNFIEDSRVGLPGYVPLASASCNQFDWSRRFRTIVIKRDAFLPRASRVAQVSSVELSLILQ